MEKNKTAQQDINIADVRGSFAFTKDSKAYCFLQLQPISTALMSIDDKQRLAKRLTRAVSPLAEEMKMIFISRPTDVKNLIDYYENIKDTTENQARREGLSQTIKYISSLSQNNAVLERQTYLSLHCNLSLEQTAQQNELEELSIKSNRYIEAFSTAGVVAHLCDEQEIIQMLSLFYIPVYSSNFSYSLTPNYTFLKTEGEKDEK